MIRSWHFDKRWGTEDASNAHLLSSALLISGPIHPRYRVTSGPQIYDHFTTMMIDMVKQKAAGYDASWHRSKNCFIAHFHGPFLLKLFFGNGLQGGSRFCSIRFEKLNRSFDIIWITSFQAVSCHIINFLRHRSNVPVIDG